MGKIKNIIFDFGVVLINLERERFLNNFKAIGVKNIESLTGTALHKGVFADFELGNISKEEFYNNIISISEYNITPKDVENAWLSMLSDIPKYKLEKLLELKSDYNLFLLSNTNELHWDVSADEMFRLDNYGAEDFFDEIWLSYKLHKMKPADDIFEYILNISGINPEETLFVDDAEANCITANKYGIKTYQPSAGEDWREKIDMILSDY